MNPRELMIGNYVKKNGIVVRCDSLSITDCYQNPILYEPIIITDDWLQKLGFKQNDKEPKKYEFKQEMSFSDFFIESWARESLYAIRVKYGVKDLLIAVIEHIHHLQNLWYFLAGDEL